MSKDRAGTGRRMIFRFSSSGLGRPAGIILFSSSLLSLTIGFVRGELAALLWGGSLAGLYLICGISVLITALININSVKRIDPRESLVFHGRTGEIGISVSGDFSFSGTIPRLPGIIVEYREIYCFRNRFFQLSKSLGYSNRSVSLSGLPENRGRYTGKASLLIRDFPGFFETEIPLGGEGQFSVFPERKKPESGNHFPSMGGMISPEVRTRRENSDFYEVRKFYPGDDPRRLHWKLYAHSGELFLRKGEPEPPPSGLYQIVLDLSIGSPLLSSRLPFFAGHIKTMRLYILEQLVSGYTGLLEHLLATGGTLVLFIPGQSGTFTFSPGEEKKLLAFLSGLWEPEVCQPFPPGIRKNDGVFFCTNPFSLLFDEYHSRLVRLEGRRRVSILCPSPPPGMSDSESLPTLFHYLLFSKSGRINPISRKMEEEWFSGIRKLIKKSGEDLNVF